MRRVSTLPRFVGIANGPPDDPRTNSGIPCHLFAALARSKNLVGAVSCAPSKWQNDVARALAFAPSLSAWRSQYRMSLGLTRAAERNALRGLRGFASDAYDAIFQIGAYCNIAAAAGKPVALYVDCDVLTTQEFDSRLARTPPRSLRARASYEGAVFHAAVRIFTASEWIAERICAKYGVARDRLECVGSGSNIDERFLMGERDYAASHVVFIGGEFERKGGPQVLEAFAKVRAQLPGARLTVIGGLPAGDVAPGVRSLGFISRAADGGEQRVADVLCSGSLFVMPSLYEPLGIVFLEAMAAGLPCIGTSHCAMPEIIGETGAVVPPADVPALARAMYDLLSDPQALAERGRRARERYAERYGWDRLALRASTSLRELAPAL